MKYDAIVMGAGHNGLIAASYLAKAGKSVLMLEAADEIGGATASVRAFKEYDAMLSRYSYLVALLPDQIVSDLGLNFETLSREVSSFTPYVKDGKELGLHISRIWDKETEESFKELTGSDLEGKQWQEFYSDVEKFAQKMAPTFLQPLLTRSEMKAHIGENEIWEYLVEKPMSEIIKSKFSNDLVRGVVLTDALIGTFVSAESIQSNGMPLEPAGRNTIRLTVDSNGGVISLRVPNFFLRMQPSMDGRVEHQLLVDPLPSHPALILWQAEPISPFQLGNPDRL
mgnify:CR=1 FL=1